MIGSAVHKVVALALGAVTLSFVGASRADDVTVAAPAASAPVEVQSTPVKEKVRTTESTGPDARAVGGGIFTFGVSYAVAFGVAATSGHQGDRHLYVPLAGPWVDFGDRGACPTTGSCGNETMFRVLIVADGIFQALGALSVVSGFLFPTTHEVTTTTATTTSVPTIRVVPDCSHGGLGLAALGTF
jgi:hypothetical protein